MQDEEQSLAVVDGLVEQGFYAAGYLDCSGLQWVPQAIVGQCVEAGDFVTKAALDARGRQAQKRAHTAHAQVLEFFYQRGWQAEPVESNATGQPSFLVGAVEHEGPPPGTRQSPGTET